MTSMIFWYDISTRGWINLLSGLTDVLLLQVQNSIKNPLVIGCYLAPGAGSGMPNFS